jgi:hypothetical protein
METTRTSKIRPRIPSRRLGRIVRTISVSLDRPCERSMMESKAFARICAMARETLGSGGLEENAAIGN